MNDVWACVCSLLFEASLKLTIRLEGSGKLHAVECCHKVNTAMRAIG